MKYGSKLWYRLCNKSCVHALFLGFMCAISRLLLRVFGPLKCVFNVLFVKINFQLSRSWTPVLQDEYRSNKLHVLSNNCSKWTTYHSDNLYFIKLGYDLVTRWTFLYFRGSVLVLLDLSHFRGGTNEQKLIKFEGIFFIIGPFWGQSKLDIWQLPPTSHVLYNLLALMLIYAK